MALKHAYIIIGPIGGVFTNYLQHVRQVAVSHLGTLATMFIGQVLEYLRIK